MWAEEYFVPDSLRMKGLTFCMFKNKEVAGSAGSRPVLQCSHVFSLSRELPGFLFITRRPSPRVAFFINMRNFVFQLQTYSENCIGCLDYHIPDIVELKTEVDMLLSSHLFILYFYYNCSRCCSVVVKNKIKLLKGG